MLLLISAKYFPKVYFKSLKSTERSEDSCIGLGDFFPGKVLKRSNNYRCASIDIKAFMNALRYKCTF